MTSTSTVEARGLRDVLGRFPTGVAVVTTSHQGRFVGLTVNSFTSLSLTPPLVLWCLGRDSRCHPAFTAAEQFAVNVLAADQRHLAARFAGPGDRFRDTATHRDRSGLPLLAGSVAFLVCRTRQLVPAGDHVIVIGEVGDHHATREPALVFMDGRYSSSPVGNRTEGVRNFTDR